MNILSYHILSYLIISYLIHDFKPFLCRLFKGGYFHTLNKTECDRMCLYIKQQTKHRLCRISWLAYIMWCDKLIISSSRIILYTFFILVLMIFNKLKWFKMIKLVSLKNICSMLFMAVDKWHMSTNFVMH